MRVNNILGSLDIIGSVVEFCDIMLIYTVTPEENLVFSSKALKIGLWFQVQEQVLFEQRNEILTISLVNW